MWIGNDDPDVGFCEHPDIVRAVSKGNRRPRQSRVQSLIIFSELQQSIGFIV